MTTPTQPMTRRRVMTAAAAGSLGLAFPTLRAQGLPPLARVLVGFAAGGSPDYVARRLAEGLTGKLAASVVVENRPGAGSRIALDTARQSPPDGLTLLLSPAGIVATNPHTYRQLNYDPVKDLTPITLTNTLSFGFAVGPAVPPHVRDIASFAAWAKGQSGTIAFGTPAAGAPPHFIGDLLSRSLKLGMTHVAYRGGAPALNDLYGGSIASLSLTLGDLIKPAEAQRLRILAVSGSKRSVFAPEVPTFAEQGIKSLDRNDWFGLYVAGKAAPEVVQRLSAITKDIQTGDAYQKAMRSYFLEPAWSTPQELAQRGQEDLLYWGPIIKASGFTADS
ncbi:MAG: tripartite tricarboxylate transporter substrate-binding protein [Hydrogenophaga sp.]|uniref:tripartite tricarboxylate transporter substrate-binding protein n=1 Tax=Hydrogenophaga sp. TaxID=1904254 RepID=UPI00271FE3EB|nr:tripartite tricarboxylate transporter substrate-binding protein [Hydrogenophaga sp.]MDO9505378.1 tripartite tricarboxylate transporter substrate-binding protein [Hydrogenophaga sp.]MDP2094830.1 tripartite tricarboxylate transporter substrate-binding protein [Hydrogenophaga sp.]MDP3374718.1 tripartite tricarboxylate transporter substrate-binding protein [Hydrogenophaga sp.]